MNFITRVGKSFAVIIDDVAMPAEIKVEFISLDIDNMSFEYSFTVSIDGEVTHEGKDIYLTSIERTFFSFVDLEYNIQEVIMHKYKRGEL
jgi:ABC-type uncharacterized transport system substrate-binding protein